VAGSVALVRGRGGGFSAGGSGSGVVAARLHWRRRERRHEGFRI
jgi:hypothetical protein